MATVKYIYIFFFTLYISKHEYSRHAMQTFPIIGKLCQKEIILYNLK